MGTRERERPRCKSGGGGRKWKNEEKLSVSKNLVMSKSVFERSNDARLTFHHDAKSDQSRRSRSMEGMNLFCFRAHRRLCHSPDSISQHNNSDARLLRREKKAMKFTRDKRRAERGRGRRIIHIRRRGRPQASRPRSAGRALTTHRRTGKRRNILHGIPVARNLARLHDQHQQHDCWCHPLPWVSPVARAVPSSSGDPNGSRGAAPASRPQEEEDYCKSRSVSMSTPLIVKERRRAPGLTAATPYCDSPPEKDMKKPPTKEDEDTTKRTMGRSSTNNSNSLVLVQSLQRQVVLWLGTTGLGLAIVLYELLPPVVWGALLFWLAPALF